MASNLKYAVALKAARMNLISTQAGASAVLEIYEGAQPTDPDTGLSAQILLASMACSATLAATTAGPVLTFNAISDGTGTAGATAGGKTATWARLRTAAAGAGGVGLVDFSVGASGCDINMTPDAVIKTGQTVSITALTITSAE